MPTENPAVSFSTTNAVIPLCRRDLSKVAAAQSVLGAAKLIIDGIYTPSDIEEMVTTPGGTTIEGIYEIEDGKLRTALMNAVQSATNKCTNIRYVWEKKS